MTHSIATSLRMSWVGTSANTIFLLLTGTIAIAAVIKAQIFYYYHYYQLLRFALPSDALAIADRLERPCIVPADHQDFAGRTF